MKSSGAMRPTIEDLRGAFRSVLKCARCGCEVVLTSPQAMNRKYCDDCQKVVYAELRKKSKEAYRERHRTDGLHGDQKRCERCGVLFEKRGYRKYCDDCQKIVKREQSDESRKQKKNPPVGEAVESTCKICGKPFAYVYKGGMRRKFCDRCSGNRVTELQVVTNSNRPLRQKKKTRVSQIEAINAAARKAGMSYGQYQALRAMGRV